MKCEHTQRRLTALLDGELGGVETWRLRRHVKRCSTCATFADELVRLDELASSWRHVAAPPGLRSRLQAALAEASRPDRPAAGSVVQQPALWFRVFKESTLMRRSVSMGLVAAAALALFLFSGRRSDPAYAQLERAAAAYRQIRTAHYFGWHVDREGHRTEIESWYARPYLSWGWYGDELRVNDGQHVWTYRAGSRTATYMDATDLEAESWQRLFDVEKHLERARRGYGLQDLGTEIVGGAPLRKILLAGEGYSEREIWWLDPATHLVRRQQIERRDSPLSTRWQMVGGSTRIEYNVVPPKGLFQFKPPPGVRVVAASADQRLNYDQFWPRGQVLRRQKAGGNTIELLEFSQSPRGDLLVVLRPTPYLPLRALLTDSAGGRYVGYDLHSGSQQELEFVTVFFREGGDAARPEPRYQLRVHLSSGLGDRWADRDDSEPLTVFDSLNPRSAAPNPDRIAEEYTLQHADATLDFYRAAALGFVALRQGRTTEAQPNLERAAALSGSALARLSNPHEIHEVLLELIDLNIKAGRREDARSLLLRLHRAVTYDQKITSVALRAGEAMERLGDRDTAVRWTRELIASREFQMVPRYVLRLTKTYERLTGDRAGAAQLLVDRLKPFLLDRSILGSGDGWEMGQALEAAGRADLALEAYTKALEASGMLEQYRASGGKLWREDTEKFIAQVRRLGGEAAVKRLTVHPLPPDF
jgi:tetratricopeptide (TPR) repeat protein/outer membrane lipoprotein-sorting protein